MAPLAGKVAMVWLKGRLPEALGQTALPVAEQVQLPEVMPAGRGSATTVPSAATAPVLVAVTV